VKAAAGVRPNLYVFQPTDAEYLGLIEDHLEGRGIGFTYIRPHVAGTRMPANTADSDGLILLGGGPWGAVGPPRLAVRDAAVRLARDAFERGKLVIGIGLGAQILAIAAGGGAEPAPFTFRVSRARRVADDALGGLLPESYPLITYMRDRPRPPAYARILAVDEAGEPALFQAGPRAFGFAGHPGVKSAIVEDLVLEFDEAPEHVPETLTALRAAQHEIEDALVRIMAGLLRAAPLAAVRPSNPTS
jgi:GMP synthase-like glutamine amidotransferase